MIDGVKEGLQQYYDIEQTTDLYSLNTGRVMAKIGINDRTDIPNKVPVSFIIIDNKPHLNESGIDYLCKWVKTLYLVTTNKEHIAYNLCESYDNLVILDYDKLDLKLLLERSIRIGLFFLKCQIEICLLINWSSLEDCILLIPMDIYLLYINILIWQTIWTHINTLKIFVLNTNLRLRYTKVRQNLWQ
jgi:hypothetical protein